MSKDYKQIDWACDRESRARWIDEEDRMMASIDRKMRKGCRRTKYHKNHRTK